MSDEEIQNFANSTISCILWYAQATDMQIKHMTDTEHYMTSQVSDVILLADQYFAQEANVKV